MTQELLPRSPCNRVFPYSVWNRAVGRRMPGSPDFHTVPFFYDTTLPSYPFIRPIRDCRKSCYARQRSVPRKQCRSETCHLAVFFWLRRVNVINVVHHN